MNSSNPRRETAWSGAVCGGLLLGVLTLGIFRWMQGSDFDSQDWLLIFAFKFPDGAVLGLLSNVAWALWRSGQRQRAARLCTWGGGWMLLIALAFFQMGNSVALSATQNFSNWFCWLGGTLIWSGLMLVIGIGMHWRAHRR